MAKKKKKAEIVLTPEQQLEADYQKAVRRMEGAEKMLQPEDKVHMYKEAMLMFETLGDYKDSEVRRKRCKKRLPLARREHREDVYQTGMRLKEEAKSSADYEAAITQFHRLRREYKDIPDQIAECEKLRENARKNERVKGLVKKLSALAALAAAVVLVIFLRSPAAYYLEGTFLMGIQDYERANTIFASSKGYRDTKEKLVECNYQRAMAAAGRGDFTKAVSLLRDKVGDYKDALEKKAKCEMEILKTAKVGDIVSFGTARWIVAETASQPQKILLIRKRPSQAKEVYQETGRAALWETSKMRAWLNQDFYQSCFSGYEQAAVAQTQVTTSANSAYGTQGGNITNDYVFLLDEQEAERYGKLLASSETQKAWWLRTPGKSEGSTVFVSAEGKVMHYGYASDTKDIAVRPAIWVQIPSGS